MKRILMMLSGILYAVFCANAAELSTAPSQDLLAVYKQLQNIQGSRRYASVEEVILKRDVGTFTLHSGSITFAAPIAGKVLAAQFEGEGLFELAPLSPVDQRRFLS
jgi:hypothetical protein